MMGSPLQSRGGGGEDKGTPLRTPRASTHMATPRSSVPRLSGGAPGGSSIHMTASEAAALAASSRAALSSATASEGGTMGGESSNSRNGGRGPSLGASYIRGEDGAARSYRDMLQKSTRILKTAGQSFGESALTPMGKGGPKKKKSSLSISNDSRPDLRL